MKLNLAAMQKDINATVKEAKAGVAYVVETAPTPSGPWREVPNTSVTSPHVTFAPPSGASSAFFRVKRVR